MVSHLFYYQLALLAIVWIFILLHLTGSKPSPTPTTAPAMPIKPKRIRSKEPKPFEGLTKKPHCALCERDAVEPSLLLRRRPIPCPPRTAVPVP